MDAFQRELMRRSRLAGSVLEISDFILNDQLLDSIYSRFRGRCYEDILRFGDFLRLMRDALVRHDGSGHNCSSNWKPATPIPLTKATSTANSHARPWRSAARCCASARGGLPS